VALRFGGQFGRQHEAGHCGDLGRVESSHQALQPRRVQQHVVVGVGHDRRGGAPRAGVARDVEAGPILAHVDHSGGPRHVARARIDRGVVDHDDFMRAQRLLRQRGQAAAQLVGAVAGADDHAGVVPRRRGTMLLGRDLRQHLGIDLPRRRPVGVQPTMRHRPTVPPQHEHAGGHVGQCVAAVIGQHDMAYAGTAWPGFDHR
jgi:hypothetical protein